MTIKNDFFYHLHRSNEYDALWQIGSKFSIGNTLNKYSKEILTMQPRKVAVNNTPCHLLEGIRMFNDSLKNNHFDCDMEKHELLSYLNEFELRYSKSVELLNSSHFNLLQYIKYYSESIFEGVRQEFFLKLPSRKTCIWVVEENNIDNWLNTLTSGGYRSIYKLKLNGVIHKTDGSLISNDTFGLIDVESRANNYWSEKNSYNSSIDPEILFEGNVEIIEKLEGYFD